MIKQKVNLTVLLIVCLLISIIISAIFMAKLAGVKFEFPKKQEAIVSDNSKLSTPEPIIDDSIKFDVEKAKIGDKIGIMTITAIRGYKAEKATGDNAFVDFKGRVQVTGDVLYIKPGGYLGGVCMENLDKDSQAKMPKMISQSYVQVGFCFNDLEVAKKLLVKNEDDKNQGRATVIIENYKIQWFPTSIMNAADLISVSK